MLSRRELFNLTGAAIAGLAGGPAAAAPQAAADLKTQDLDLVVFNAKVYTVDSRTPRVEAFAVKDSRFVAVGTTEEMKGLIGKRTQTYDAKQMTIVPGMIDCHNHCGGATVLYEVLVGNPYQAEFVTISSIIEKLRKKASGTPQGTWVEGFFHDDMKLKDGRFLNVHDLDQASTDHPIEVHHRGGHTSFYNSKAFEMAGVTKNTPNPSDGTYDHSSDGELNGRVTDRARIVFAKVGVRPTFTPEQTLERDRDGLAYISRQFVKCGLTSVHHEGGNLYALQQVRARGELLHRVSYEAAGDVLEAMIAAGIQTGFGDEWIRFGATSEHTIDGSFSERTMTVKAGYPGITPPYYGNITETAEVLNPWVERMYRAGIQPNVHANGDTSIDVFLTAVERARSRVPRADVRPKITHCTLINDDLLRRIKAVNAVPAMFASYSYYNGDKFHFYGEENMRHSMAYRSMLDLGIWPAVGSDFSPGPFDPRMAIQGMVTRKGYNGEVWGANQRISVAEALKVNTINGAYNSHEEKIKGSITPGKLADFVVLAEDPHTMNKEKIKDVQVVRTVTGGKTVYKA